MKKSLFLFLVLIGVFGFSQTLGSRLDKGTLALGEVGTFKISVFDLNGKKVEIAPKNKLLPFHFEVIKDSINITENQYDRIITFAIFEEGKFKIPTLDVKIGGLLYSTVPYEVEVINTAKSGDQISDIMNNKEVKLRFWDYWEIYKWYLLGFLALIALIFIIIKFIKFNKKRKDSPEFVTHKTLKELDLLKKKKYIEAGNYRSFYVELIDISRNFLTEQYKIPADVLLTDDLVELIKKNNTISQENEKVVETVFQRGDLVKFAKIFPDRNTMEEDFKNTRELVKRSIKDIEFENLRKDV
ncbi:MAG: BatD family protein [Flavobacteriaceae bacterium]|nr:BatD family protein [Flavobacteriaceae bacterium]